MPGEQHHSKLIANIQPFFRLRANHIDVAGFEEFDVAGNKVSILHKRIRQVSARRIDRDPAQKRRAAIEIKLVPFDFKRPEAEANLAEAVSFGFYRDFIKLRIIRLPEFRAEVLD